MALGDTCVDAPVQPWFSCGWGTFHFRDIAQNRSGGRNVFGNIGAVYRGSSGGPDEDKALNTAVERYAANPQAVRDLRAAGAADRLVQVYTEDSEHSYPAVDQLIS